MVWWILATFFAYFIKGLCGFANTLIFTSILSFGNSNINISPVELLLGFNTNFIMAYRGRDKIEFKLCLPIILLIFLGSIPGILFLKNADTKSLKVLFGIVILLIVGQMYFSGGRYNLFSKNKFVFIFVGILSGVLCGLYGVGALLGAYLSSITEDSNVFKANMSFIFVIENSFRIVLYIVGGIITFDILKNVILLYPVMLVGLYAGIFCSKFFDERLVKKCIMAMLLISGISLIVSNL